MAKNKTVINIHARNYIAAIFENEAVETLSLGKVNETPTLLEVHRRGHLDSDMLTMLHGILRHGVVVIPICCDVDKVYIFALAQRLVATIAMVCVGWHHARLIEEALARLGTLRLVVAECHNLDTRDMHKAHHSPWTTHTETHEAHAQRLDGLDSETHNMLLTLRSLGAIYDNSATIPMPSCRL